MKKLLIGLALLSPFAQAQDANLDREFECLAKNIYFEARNQSHLGKIAVAQVVLNRVHDDRYPKSTCGVVEQAKKKNGVIVRHKCQFSWFCDGLSDRPRDEVAWADAQAVAWDAIILWDTGYDLTEGATHYHTKYVTPFWKDSLTYITSVDEHQFYRWEN